MNETNDVWSKRIGKPVCGALLAVSLISYLWLALYPFQWQPPRRVTNGARRTDSGSLRFAEPGVARSRLPESWLNTVRRTNRFHLRLRARAFESKQKGPARLFTISDGRTLRNFTVGHDRASLVIRLRRPGASANGTPEYRGSKVFKTSDWRTIDIQVEPGSLKISVDGKVIRTEPLPPAALADWNPTFLTAIGNELTGDRPWLGEIAEATLNVDGQTIDYLAADRLKIPESYWDGLTYQPGGSFARLFGPDSSPVGAVLNFIGFVTIGFLIVTLRGPSRSSVSVIVGCALLSLTVEAAQVVLDSHVPSETDWILNTLGAIVGVYAARRVFSVRGERFLNGEQNEIRPATASLTTVSSKGAPQSESSHGQSQQ